MYIKGLVLLLFFVSLSYQLKKFEVNKGNNSPFSKQSKLAKPATNIVINPEDIGRYINQIRTAPSMLIPLIEQKMAKGEFNNKSDWEEALNYVKGLEKTPTCNYSVVLDRAAMDHAAELVSRKSLSHVGNNGSSLVERIEKYTDFNNGTVAEAIVYESISKTRNHPLEILITLIVSEGIPSKVYRKAFFDP